MPIEKFPPPPSSPEKEHKVISGKTKKTLTEMSDAAAKINIKPEKTVWDKMQENIDKRHAEIEKSLKEDLGHFVNKGDDAKERYVLYTLLKYYLGYGNQVNRGAQLDDYRSIFNEDINPGIIEEIGFAWDTTTALNLSSMTTSPKSRWVQPGLINTECGSYIIDIKNIDSKIRNFIQHRVDEFDTAEKKPSDETLAKTHNEEWYTHYKLVKNYGFYADYNWSIDQLKKQMFDHESAFHGERTAYKARQKAKKDKIESVFISKKQEFEEEYDRLRHSP